MQGQKQRNASINLLVKREKKNTFISGSSLPQTGGIPGPKEISCLITHHQRSCGKVIFSRVFICPFRYLWSHVPSRGIGCLGGRVSGAVFRGVYTPWERTLLRRSVRILLEYFLVLGSFPRKPLENEKRSGLRLNLLTLLNKAWSAFDARSL